MKLNRENAGCGFTWIDFLIIIAVVILLAVVGLPMLAKRYARASKISCTNNLKQVALSYRQWALDNGDTFPMKVSVTNGGSLEQIEKGVVYMTFLVMSNELVTPMVLICPEEKDRRRARANTFEQTALPGATSGRIPFTNDNNVSYFVGVDADEGNPKSMLGGDDNFLVGGVLSKPGLLLLDTNSSIQWTKARHVSRGNIAFADGSVMGVSNSALTRALLNTGMTTNRLAMPQ
jgi:prepilin-type processing-associated H-X9-DG protein